MEINDILFGSSSRFWVQTGSLGEILSKMAGYGHSVGDQAVPATFSHSELVAGFVPSEGVSAELKISSGE